MKNPHETHLLPEEAVLLVRKNILAIHIVLSVLILAPNLHAQRISVWPGDANNDGVVNNLDLLPVGTAFGLQGNSRDSISVSWREFETDRWIDSLPTGLNAGYVDCSGNGLINIDDVFAIEINYGETNPNFTGLQFQQGTIYDPHLSIIPNQGLWLPGDTVRVTIFLTQSADDSIYSVAFTFYYDTSLIQENSLTLWPHPQFGGGGTQPIYVQKNFPDSAYAEFAISRTNRKNHGGNLSVAYASFIIEDNLIGKTFLDVANAFRIDKIRLHDKAMKNIPAMGDSMDAKISTVVPERKLKQWLNVYPVPAVQYVMVEFSEDILLQDVCFIDVNGKTFPASFNVAGKSALIEVSGLSSGMYIMRIITNIGTTHEKVLISK